MGVTGLWKLIEPAGKPVPLETLENKVLAVDISIWIHQVIKGFQDSRGGTVPNAHLLGLFNRLCKLLYYRVKPVFVFDGGVPNLKVQTIAKRNQLKNKYVNESERIQQQILNTLIKHKAVQHLLKGNIKKLSPKKISPEKAVSSKVHLEDDMFKLPPIVSEEIQQDDTLINSSDDDSEDTSWTDLHTVDVESKEFKSLPLETQYDILQDLKESRKQSSWGRLHELPEQSDDFSSFQMKRLRKRRAIQVTLDEVEKEMGGHALSMTDLERILTDEGILAAEGSSASQRIVSDDTKKYLYIKDLKAAISQAMKNKNTNESVPNKLPRIEEANSEDELEMQTCDDESNIKTLKNILSQKKISDNVEEQITSSSKVEDDKNDDLGIEFDKDLQEAIRLSLQTEENKCNDSLFESFNETLDESKIDDSDTKNMALARAYMMENSDLTQNEIHKLIRENNKKMRKGSHRININHILKNLPSTKPKSEVETYFIKNENISTENLEIENANLKSLEKSVIVQEISSDSDDEFIEVTSDKNIVVISKESVSVTTASSVIPEKELEKTDFAQVSGNEIEFNEVTEDIQSHLQHHKKENTLETNSSDSDCEFIEVQPKLEPKKIEIVISKDNIMHDDLFADIFNDNLVKVPKVIGLNDEVSTEIKNITVSGTVDIDAHSSNENMSMNIIEDKILEMKDTLQGNVIKIDETLEKNKLDNIDGKDLLVKPIFQNETKNIIHENTSFMEKDVISIENPKSPTTKFCISDIKPNALNDVLKIETDKLELNKEELISVHSEPKTPKKGELSGTLPQMTEKELEIMSDQLEKETNLLMIEKSKQDRMGNTISEQMTKDIQDLLQLFGIPYIVAPMEAEAQCAFLNEIKLTDGTITDDSDIWLFGGKTVYKNFFDQKKYVMEFRDENIFHHFKLSREQLIQFALLVGSDYTVGIPSVGPVTALEILAAFPSKDDILSGLTNFKLWFQDGCKVGPGRTALISKLKKVNLSEGFPSLHVVRAYLDPTVETSKEPFRWGQPDLTILREYTRTKFGWTTAKTDDILKPIITKMNMKQTQKTIKDFFHIRDLKIGSVDKLSKRVQLAVDKLSGRVAESDDEKKELATEKSTKRQRKTKSTKETRTENKCANKKPNARATKADTLAKKLHAKEVIPQKEKDKAELLKNKMKAVEVFRKSKKGPGYVKNQKRTKPEPLEDANLSESSDD